MSNTNPNDRNKHGKQFEKIVREFFKDKHKTLPIEFKRVLDSASAGNIIEKADGDYELTINSGVYGQPYRFRIECKASILNDTLASCFRSLVRPHQDAKMRLSNRLGVFGVYLYHAVHNDEIEVWFARPMCDEYEFKRKKFHGQPAYVVSRQNFPHVVDEWLTQPAEFIRKLLRSEELYRSSP